MRTSFDPARLADPDVREVNDILRTCVHCGFCLATCPTYLVLGDELDSPRGRIYLAKDMLENDAPATPQVVKHLDRCLTCLSCMSTCPSGVHYAHLVDQARVHIEETYTRPLGDRLMRRLLATLVPRPWLFRVSSIAGRFARPLAGVLPGRIGAMVASSPAQLRSPSAVDRPQVFAAAGERRMRVALMRTCVQQVMRPEISEATVRLLTRHGCEVVVAEGSGCCGAIAHHLGDAAAARKAARANIAAWSRVLEEGGLDAVVFNASGCGVSLRDYGHLLRGDPDFAAAAERFSALSRDVSEVIRDLGLAPLRRQPDGLVVTYHAACSMQHGLGLKTEAKELLMAAGYHVRTPAEPHICCGSAGTYSILQPELATQLRDRKITHLAATAPDVIAAGNIGCITHLAAATDIPMIHTVELLDWATGGPKPVEMA